MYSLAPARRYLRISSSSSQMIWVLGTWDVTDTRLPSPRTWIASQQADSGLPISTAPAQSAARPGFHRTVSAVCYLTHAYKIVFGTLGYTYIIGLFYLFIFFTDLEVSVSYNKVTDVEMKSYQV